MFRSFFLRIFLLSVNKSILFSLCLFTTLLLLFLICNKKYTSLKISSHCELVKVSIIKVSLLLRFFSLKKNNYIYTQALHRIAPPPFNFIFKPMCVCVLNHLCITNTRTNGNVLPKSYRCVVSLSKNNLEVRTFYLHESLNSFAFFLHRIICVCRKKTENVNVCKATYISSPWMKSLFCFVLLRYTNKKKLYLRKHAIHHLIHYKPICVY